MLLQHCKLATCGMMHTSKLYPRRNALMIHSKMIQNKVLTNQMMGVINQTRGQQVESKIKPNAAMLNVFKEVLTRVLRYLVFSSFLHHGWNLMKEVRILIPYKPMKMRKSQLKLQLAKSKQLTLTTSLTYRHPNKLKWMHIFQEVGFCNPHQRL